MKWLLLVVIAWLLLTIAFASWRVWRTLRIFGPPRGFTRTRIQP